MSDVADDRTETNDNCCRWLKILAWGDFQGRIEGEDFEKFKERFDKSPEHLEKIYEEQMEWARHFNQLIWTISAIIIPASLAGLALSFRGNDGKVDFGWFLATAIGSFFLILYWALQVFWHVSLWKRAFVLTGLIEEKWGVRDAEEDVVKYADHLLSRLTRLDLGMLYIWIFMAFFIFAWSLKGVLLVIGRCA